MADGAGRFHTAPPHKGQSTLVSAALGVESPVVGIRGPLGIQHRHTDCASPRGSYPKRAPHRAAPGGPPSPRCMQSRSQEAPGSAPRAGGQLATRRSDPHPPLFRVGPRPNPMPGAAHRPIRDLGRNPAATSRVQARAGAHESVGGRPRVRGRA
ncbi:hypothetical protein NDU88_005085 [Pleurodeles waltl]|uniref:Uncharacterized protein n=1 Tax=Pleurodeles waltl TaxID=8319 RepID=A0AAV7MID7_PLEWA|nr:hypothetical protein NDU88_005085 [Pleurodeles waltl]